MRMIENISTYRLELVELQEGMVDFIHNIIRDNVVMEFMPFDAHKNLEDTIHWVAECIENNLRGNEMTWLIEDKKCFCIGWVSAKRIGDNSYLISYAEKKEYWGNGYMQEAVNRIFEFLFTKCKAEMILAMCHPRNRRSEKVMQSVGMRRIWLNKKCIDKASGELVYQHCYIIDKFGGGNYFE